MRHIHYISLVLMLLMTLPASAQSDFGLDLGASAEKKLTKNLGIEVDANLRTQDNTRRVERWTLGIGVDQRVLNTKQWELKLGLGWEYLWTQQLGECENKYDDDDATLKGYNITDRYWQNRHRTTFSLGTKFTPNKRWTFSLKESLQYNHYNAIDSIGRTKYRFKKDGDGNAYTSAESDPKVRAVRDRFVLRSKLTVQYDIRHCPLSPFVAGDYGCGLNYSANKWKMTAGTDIKFNKTNKLSVYYRFQTEDDEDEPDGHLLGISYNIKL